MRRWRYVAWILLVVWCAWLFAAQGFLSTEPAIGLWAPDLGLLFLFALDSRLDRSDGRLATLLIAATRVSFSTDPPLAVFAGYLGAFWLIGRLREIVEIDRPLPRVVLAGTAAFVLSGFWVLSRILALPPEVSVAPSPEMIWRSAVSTAVGALVLLPLLRSLPGLSPLWRNRT